MIHDPNANTRQTISKIHNVHSDHRTLHHFEQSLKCPCELAYGRKHVYKENNKFNGP